MEAREKKFLAYKEILSRYLPQPTIEVLSNWIIDFKIHLKIKKARSTKFGDYYYPTSTTGHIITINHNLNKYAFLITLVHEIAHLKCWEKHKHRVKPHGPEWKQEFKMIMDPFLTEEIFPDDLLKIIRRYLYNPAASSCTDVNLYRALKLHNTKVEGVVFLEELPDNTTFKFISGRTFVKEEKLRKRYRCRDILNNKLYLVSPLAEVIAVE